LAAVANQPWPSPLTRAFNGKWIWQEADGPANSWMAFRKTVSLPKAPVSVKALIAADTKYWLWINDKLAVFEGGLKRGPTRSDGYVDEVEIAPFLTAGNNTIAVLVWYYGKDTMAHKSSGMGGLFFEADASGISIVSDQTWKLKPDSAYGPQTLPGRAQDPFVEYDARKDIGDWTAPGFADASWTNATAKGAPPTAPWGRLWPRGIPQWRNSGIVHYVNQASLPRTGNGEVVHARLPSNIQVTPYLRVNAPSAGLQITMMTDRSGPEMSAKARYVTRAGEQTYESFGWMSGTEVLYTVPAGVEILELGYRETGYDADFAGSFKCDDDTLNTLWTKAQRTLYINMRDNYMDCPTRERALWWGDIVNDLGQTYYALDRRADLLTRNAINSLMEWQDSKGILRSPLGNYDKEVPTQMLLAVGVASLWNYYMQTGDLAAMSFAYPHVKSYLGVWQRDAKGLVVHRTSDDSNLRNWTDSGNNIDMGVIDNELYYMALDGAARMTELLGKPDDAAGYRSIMSEIKPAFLSAYWNGACLDSPGYRGADDRANGLGVVAGLLGPAEWPAVKTVLSENTKAGVYLEKFVLEAFFRMNDARGGLARMRSRYAEMIKSPYPTLWEDWMPRTGTINHGWTGGPLTLLSQYVAGVAPTKPGYEQFAVLPQLGDLTSVEAKVPSARGTITVSVSSSPARYSLAVTVPAGTTATVGVPDTACAGGASGMSISLNNVQVFSAGAAKGSIPGVTFAGDSAGYIRFTVAPGTWNIVATPTR
jgi:hypothetical protein